MNLNKYKYILITICFVVIFGLGMALGKHLYKCNPKVNINPGYQDTINRRTWMDDSARIVQKYIKDSVTPLQNENKRLKSDNKKISKALKSLINEINNTDSTGQPAITNSLVTDILSGYSEGY